jgi:hypothetical protein
MRTLIAFYVAPLAVPLILLVHPATLAQYQYAVGFGVVVAYVGTFMLGMPIYIFLCARQLTTFWIAPIVGFAIGMVMWYVFFFLLMLALNAAISSAISSIVAGIFDGRIFLEALRIGGPAGAAVGIVLWLIARPDRRVLLECPEPQSKA